jgi:NAD(P)-dependent dehydrogenase (short-subunit alcohol dehydrogenase family)
MPPTQTPDFGSAVTLTIETLEAILHDSAKLAQLTREQRVALMKVAGQLSRPDAQEKKERTKKAAGLKREARARREREARSQTGIREARKNAVFIAPLQQALPPPPVSAEGGAESPDLESPRNCYVCKAEFTKLHFFYDTMCKSCGDFNYQKRFQTASLKGQVAVITGARLKIGYHAALLMLRSGARVIVTTRFPHDAAVRFAQEPDFALWRDHLQVHGLDLRHTPSVEIFCRYLEQTLDRLDILINNAAQTVRRPPGFYAHLMDTERKSRHELSPGAQDLLRSHEACTSHLTSRANELQAHTAGQALPVTWHGHAPGVGLRASAELSQIPYSYDDSKLSDDVFPVGQLDADLQQVDLRTTNSWRHRLAEVSTPEMVEVQLVNAIAPFVLCSRLAPLMRRDNTGTKHIVNVTAMEGKFYRFKKEDRHPHTNMAKAALNMLTHTSASDLAKDGIYMNAVDTGWVTDEDPATLAKHKQDVHDFQPPLDIVDGAARICDPFYHGLLTGHHWCGKFLKDYAPIDW